MQPIIPIPVFDERNPSTHASGRPPWDVAGDMTLGCMIPNITRGSNPSGLIRYLFGKGRHNEHTDQHLLLASDDLIDLFDMDGRPLESFARIGRQFDTRYRRLEHGNDPFPPDRRGKRNPEHQHGKDRVWHCSLAVKATEGILTDQQWQRIIEDYLQRMNLAGKNSVNASWLAVRHGLSKHGNDHVHLVVQLAADEWINPWHDRVHAQTACRQIEQLHPELTALHEEQDRGRLAYQYAQWRRWASWKCEQEHPGFNAMRPARQQALINAVAAETMPRYAIGKLVAACAIASSSEDEFIRRVRREGLNIDPRLRKGVKQGSFTKPDQVVGYTITWRSQDGWVQRMNAYDLGADLRLKALRSHQWRHNNQTDGITVAEWQAAMRHTRPVMHEGAEQQPEHLSAHDMSRLINESFHQLRLLDQAGTIDDDEQVRQALHTFDRLRNTYGLTQYDQQAAPTMLNQEQGRTV